MTDQNPDNNMQFLAGGGEMGKLMREKDWSQTPVGHPSSWPQGLRTILDVMLHSRFPMFLFWGEELVCFYNDDYRTILGNDGKHPAILGVSAKDAWPETWDTVSPMIDTVVKEGKSIWSENQPIPIYRNGKMEDGYWTFSYSPVSGDAGSVAGVYVVVTETTDKVVALRVAEENQNKLEFAIDATNLGTWDYDPATHKFGANKRLKNWFGLSDDEQIELTHATDAIAARDRHRVTDAIQRALEYDSGGIYDVEYTIMHPDTKEERAVHAKGKAWFGEDKRAYRFNGTLEDITQRAQTQSQLQESEKTFRLLADSMPQQIWISDPEGSLYYYNQAVYDYSGLSPEQIEKDGWLQIVHPEDREKNIEAWIHSIQTGQDFLFEHRFRRYDGEYRWQLSRALPQRDEDGKIKMWVGSSTDIQEQKSFADELEKQVWQRTRELLESHESLKKSEERYHLMVEEVQDYAILYLNREGIVENWNTGAEKIKGYKASEIIGRSFSNFYTPADKLNGLPEKLLAKSAATGRAVQEGWRVRKDGSLFWASVLITAVHNDKGDVIGFSKVTHDLTDKKQAEDKLKETASELKQKNSDLEKVNKELQSFAYISSHDLQEPLRKIQTFTSILMEREAANLTDSGKATFKRIQDSALRMQTLINDLLAYSRTNTVDIKYEHTDLSKIVEGVKTDLREELLQKQATIEITGLCELTIIPFQFRQLLHNLFSNSLKFADAVRPLRIDVKGETGKGSTFNNSQLSDSGDYCHISVSDNGIGFDQQYAAKIFELFQRLHGKEVYSGTGIGLAIVKRIVENHHGIITASGEMDKGARFDIYLPVR